jgi:hypothetical protein
MKKVLSVLLSVIMILSVLPLTVNAAYAASVYIGGVQLNDGESAQCVNGSVIKSDTYSESDGIVFKDHTLTLNGVTVSKGLYENAALWFSGTLDVVVNANSVIDSEGLYGINTDRSNDGSSLNIRGDHHLAVFCGDAGSEETSTGIFLYSENTNYGALNVYGKTRLLVRTGKGKSSIAINVWNFVRVYDGASVEAYASEALDGNSMGIRSVYGNIVVEEGARLTAVADTATGVSYGALTISNYYSENRGRVDITGYALFKGYDAGIKFRSSPTGNTYATEPDLPWYRTLMSKNYDGSGELTEFRGYITYTEDSVSKVYPYIKVNHDMFTVTLSEAENMHASRSGDAVQSELMWYMDEVIYTADDGYYFPSDYTALYSNSGSGIKVERIDSTHIKISGKPKSDVIVTLSAAKIKPSDYVAYDVWVGGIQLGSDNAGDVFGDGTVSFDAQTNTLTLENYAVSGSGTSNGIIDSSLDGLTLNIKGNNVVAAGEQKYAIYSTGNLQVTGDGNLTAYGGDSDSDSTCGIMAEGYTFTVNSDFTGKLIVNGGWVKGSYGISSGIFADNIIILGGFVCADGGQAKSSGCGLTAQSVIGINDATVLATGANASGKSYGMFAASISITNSVVHSKAGMLEYISDEYYSYKDDSLYSSNRRAFSTEPLLTGMAIGGAVGWSGENYQSSVGINDASSVLLVPSDYVRLGISDLKIDSGASETAVNITENSYYVELSEDYLYSYLTELNIADGKDLIIAGLHEGEPTYEIGIALAASEVEINGGRLISFGGANKNDYTYGMSINNKATVNDCDLISVSGSSYYDSYGIYVGDITFNGGSLTAIGGTAIDEEVYGCKINSRLRAQHSANITAVGGVCSYDYYSYGFSGGEIVIESDSSAVGVGGPAREYSYGSSSDVTAYSGKSIFVGNVGGYASYGLSAKLKSGYGSEITAVGGYSPYESSYGLWYSNNNLIEGTVKASGLIEAITPVDADRETKISETCELVGYAGAGFVGDGTVIESTGYCSDFRGYKSVTITALEPPVIHYKIYVGGVEITSKNADDVLGDGGTVKYNMNTGFIVLENANITGYAKKGNAYSGIYCDNGQVLNVRVNGGENSIRAEIPDSSGGYTDGIDAYYGVNIVLNNNATLNVYGADNAPYTACGIYSRKTVSVSGWGELNAYGGNNCSEFGDGIRAVDEVLKIQGLNGRLRVNAYGGQNCVSSLGVLVGTGIVNMGDYADFSAYSYPASNYSYAFWSDGLNGLTVKSNLWHGVISLEAPGCAVRPDRNYIYEYSKITYPSDCMAAGSYSRESRDIIYFSSGEGTNYTSNYYKISIFNEARIRFLPGWDSDQWMNMLVTDFDGFTLPECNFIPPEGMEFDCWDYGETGDSIRLSGDMTITAKWWKGFPDVHRGDWFYSAAKYNYKHEFITGYKNGKFGPSDALQRQDFVVILARIADARLDGYTSCPLSDVDINAYYGKAVAWAVDKGIITGYNNGKFGVGDKITREQVATIIYRFMGKPAVSGVDETLEKFNDKGSVSAFAKDAIAWANLLGIITGKNATTLAPTATAARAEIATIVMRMDKAYMFYSSPYSNRST